MFHEMEHLLPYGSLRVAGPQEQMVHRTTPGTYLPSGDLCHGAHCMGEKMVRRQTQCNGPLREDIVDVSHETAIWGGCVFNELGAFITRSVSRLWPTVPGGALDGLPVVFNRPNYPPFGMVPQAPALVNEWMAALPIPEVGLPNQGAVLFKRLLVPEPAWRIGAWIAPELRDIHLYVRERMEVPYTASHDVLWLSRSRLDHAQRAYDESLLEWLLGDRITRIHPQALTLVELVGLLENSQVVAGIAADTFHMLMVTREPPDCFCLSRYASHPMLDAQIRLLDAEASSPPPLLAGTMSMRRARKSGRIFPGDHRVLIPETLRSMSSCILPDLLDDPRLEAVARLNRAGGRSGPSALEDELDATMAQVLREPFSFGNRLALAALFEDRGLRDCAAEQYSMVAELSEDSDQVRHAMRRKEALGCVS